MMTPIDVVNYVITRESTKKAPHRDILNDTSDKSKLNSEKCPNNPQEDSKIEK